MRSYVNLFTFLLLIGISACNSGKTSGEDGSFETFYKRFHEDTAFQKSRITFPLEGIPAFADSSQMFNGSYRWQKGDWIYHRMTDSLQQNFDREFISLGDELIIEHLTHKSAQIGMERRFARLGDGWNLIYYAGMNYIK